MNPDVAFFAGIIASAVWQREHIAGIKVGQGEAHVVNGKMVMTYPHVNGTEIKVTVEIA